MTVNHRLYLPRFAALVTFFGCAALVGLAAQPPDEKEDPKGAVKKKIVVDDDPAGSKKTTGAPTGNRTGCAARRTHPRRG